MAKCLRILNYNINKCSNVENIYNANDGLNINFSKFNFNFKTNINN
jgi:hypothetical protein